jgi:hypothetical protein
VCSSDLEDVFLRQQDFRLRLNLYWVRIACLGQTVHYAVDGAPISGFLSFSRSIDFGVHSSYVATALGFAIVWDIQTQVLVFVYVRRGFGQSSLKSLFGPKVWDVWSCLRNFPANGGGKAFCSALLCVPRAFHRLFGLPAPHRENIGRRRWFLGCSSSAVGPVCRAGLQDSNRTRSDFNHNLCNAFVDLRVLAV